MASYSIDITEEAKEDAKHYKAFERKLIVDEIGAQLREQPDIETNNRKRLRANSVANWELRVGKYRVFYEIDNDAWIVSIISIGHKEHNTLYIRDEVVAL